MHRRLSHAHGRAGGVDRAPAPGAPYVKSMLSTELHTILLATWALLCGFWAWRSAHSAKKAHRIAVEALDFAKSDKYDPVGRAKIAEIEASLTELSDSYDALLSSQKRLRARIGMRAVRERRGSENDEASVMSGDDKVKLRMQAKKSGLLR